jgi:8-oxo-dGTP diphosphatase
MNNRNAEAVMQFPDVTVMNIIMIYDQVNNAVLMQDRTKVWKGGAFPGGHLEIGESIYNSCIREVREETGLEISNLIPCGLVHWSKKGGRQEFIYFYRTGTFSGELLQCDEGENKWISIGDLTSQQLSGWFREQLPIFFTKSYTELTYTYDQESDKYIKCFHSREIVPDINNLPRFTEFPENLV